MHVLIMNLVIGWSFDIFETSVLFFEQIKTEKHRKIKRAV